MPCPSCRQTRRALDDGAADGTDFSPKRAICSSKIHAYPRLVDAPHPIARSQVGRRTSAGKRSGSAVSSEPCDHAASAGSIACPGHHRESTGQGLVSPPRPRRSEVGRLQSFGEMLAPMGLRGRSRVLDFSECAAPKAVATSGCRSCASQLVLYLSLLLPVLAAFRLRYRPTVMQRYSGRNSVAPRFV